MSEPVRIGLRLLGFVMFLIGIAGVVALFKPGPGEIADWMGQNCANSETGPAEQCSTWDVVEILLVSPILILVGGVMALALRPPGKGPMTISLGGGG
jgi:hypothetical protein